MSQSPEPDAPAPRKRSKLPLIVGAVLALAGGGAGFFAVRTGLLPLPWKAAPHGHGAAVLAALPPLAPAAYVALDPLVVNLPRGSGREFLRFTAAVEVVPAAAAEVEMLRPRLLDAINLYLRAVEPADFEDALVLDRLRAQLLRRLQIVAGEGRVTDLLIIEFVLS